MSCLHARRNELTIPAKRCTRSSGELLSRSDRHQPDTAYSSAQRRMAPVSFPAPRDGQGGRLASALAVRGVWLWSRRLVSDDNGTCSQRASHLSASRSAGTPAAMPTRPPTVMPCRTSAQRHGPARLTTPFSPRKHRAGCCRAPGGTPLSRQCARLRNKSSSFAWLFPGCIKSCQCTSIDMIRKLDGCQGFPDSGLTPLAGFPCPELASADAEPVASACSAADFRPGTYSMIMTRSPPAALRLGRFVI
jgi:hypothetical protein